MSDRQRSKASTLHEIKAAGLTSSDDTESERGASMRKTLATMGLDPKPAA